MDFWEKCKEAGRWGLILTVFHVVVANIVFKWRTNGVLMWLKHLFILIEVSIFIYTTSITICVVFRLQKHRLWHCVRWWKYLIFRRNSQKYPSSTDCLSAACSSLLCVSIWRPMPLPAAWSFPGRHRNSPMDTMHEQLSEMSNSNWFSLAIKWDGRPRSYVRA